MTTRTAGRHRITKDWAPPPAPSLLLLDYAASLESGRFTSGQRMFGRPDYFMRVVVADHAAYERFQTGKLIGLPGVLRVVSHLTMKKIKAED